MSRCEPTPITAGGPGRRRVARRLAALLLGPALLGVTACGQASAAPLPTWTPPAAAPAPPSVAARDAAAEPAAVADPFDVQRLDIPALGTEAEAVEVGVSEDRVLEVPPDAQIVGRWSDGARPGDGTGSIVLVSHVDYRGVAGALKRLADLPPGSEAVLVGPDGRQARYVLEQVDIYRKAVLPYQDIFRFDVPERLVLITCGGEIDSATGRYDSNVVAYFSAVT
ncbi:MAG: class F sortase [Kineosporiaceae bacterium]